MQQWLFLDGSGKPNDHRFVAYCGYLAYIDTVQAFLDGWNKILFDEQIPYLSMKEANNWREIWELKRKQWGAVADTKRADLLMALANHTRECKVFAFTHAVNTSNAREKQIEPTEYYLFAQFMTVLFKLLGEHGNLELVIAVDEDEYAAEKIYKFYRKLRKEKKHLADQIQFIGIGNDKTIAGLQAADLLASETLRELDRQVNRPTEPASPLWSKLIEGSGPVAVTHQSLITDPSEIFRIAGIV